MAVTSVSNALSFYDRNIRVEALRSAAPVSMPALHLPAGTTSDATNPGDLNLDQSKILVGNASTALAEVRASLTQLAKLAQSAKDSGYLDAVDDLSRSTIQADMQRIIDRLDETVKAAGVAGANLVSSSSRDVRLQTTGLGGSIVAAVQALDSSALGLANIDLSTDEGVSAAIAAVTNAQANLATKDLRIQALSSAYQGQADFNTLLQSVVATTALGYSAGYGADARTQAASANRGAVVNVWA